MNDDSAHSSIWKTSDFMIGIILASGMLMEHFVIDYEIPLSSIVRYLIGLLVVTLGFTLILMARIEFNRAGQPRTPGIPTTCLVKTGVFKISRNPLYLGIVLILPGLGLAANLVWWIILTPLLMIWLQQALILPEEQYLLERFGEEFGCYKKNVRRWI